MVIYTKAYIDIKKGEDMTKTGNYSFEEISEEWENFENEILDFVTHCKSLFGKLSPLK